MASSPSSSADMALKRIGQSPILERHDMTVQLERMQRQLDELHALLRQHA